MLFRLQLSNRFENLFVFLQALNVVFEKIPENESADVCRNISVNVLDCDTIGQAKEKIFQAFLSKNGSPYGLQLNEIGLGKVCPNSWEASSGFLSDGRCLCALSYSQGMSRNLGTTLLSPESLGSS